MVALDAGHSESASMLYSHMNIKCSVSLSPSWEGGGGSDGDGIHRPRQGLQSQLFVEPSWCPHEETRHKS